MNAEATTTPRKRCTGKSGEQLTQQIRSKSPVPLVDVFSGCGGFAEGFLSYRTGKHQFDLSLAVDNDTTAHQTHLLRMFFHQFSTPPEEYYAFLRLQITIEDLYNSYPDEFERANSCVLAQELGLGPKSDKRVHGLIEDQLSGRRDWVLIGGPPCQAYSIAGRSRNKGISEYQAEADQRHFLYREYLKILAEHWPAVFVMENVPGMLNSKVNGQKLWHRILEDLVDPVTALGLHEYAGEFDGYRLYSLATRDRGVDIYGVPTLEPDEYVVRCEEYGIPQARHRVFVLGIRSDLNVLPRQLTKEALRVPCGTVLNDLPPLRSGLTKVDDSDENWLRVMRELVNAEWWKSGEDHGKTLQEARKTLRDIVVPEGGRGAPFLEWKNHQLNGIPPHLYEWIIDSRLEGVCNHESKAHMESDVQRYVFAACYTNISDRPLRLAHFPEELLPEHKKVQRAKRSELSHSNFADRFGVQSAKEPARTIVSHIAKDGHYFIHPDARQGRSLTVREAARIQTFPDNFFFAGPRTEQYRQVGNAVPPLLANQIAGIVDDILCQAGK